MAAATIRRGGSRLPSERGSRVLPAQSSVAHRSHADRLWRRFVSNLFTELNPRIMIKYKGYSIWSEKDYLGRKKWSVGTVQPDGRMLVHATGYENSLMAKRAADAHFGRL